MPTKVYQYGTGKINPILPEPMFFQLRKAHEFWNQLVELERGFSARYYELLSGIDESVSGKEVEIERLQSLLKDLTDKAGKSRSKGKGVCDASTKIEIKKLRAEIKDCKGELKENRKAAKERAAGPLKDLRDEKKAAIKSARQSIAREGLYWCNYNAVIDSYMTGQKGVMEKRKKGQPAELKFHRFTGEGRWTVQLQGGRTWEQITNGKDGQLQISPPPNAAWTGTRAERRRFSKTTARFRITSDKDKKPVWFDFPVTIHRKPENGAVFKAAQLTRRKQGHRWVWNLNLTAIQPDSDNVPVGEMIGIDLGWRKKEDGSIRVAVWASETRSGEISLDKSYVSAAERAEGLRSVIDLRFNAAKELLIAWMKNRPGLPERLIEDTKFISKWRSPAKMLRIVHFWEECPGDENIIERLRAWKRKHIHLSQWQSDLLRKIHLRRRELFRLEASRITQSASTVFFEDFNLADMAMLPRIEDSSVNAKEHAVRRVARLAGSSYLRQEFERCCAASNVKTHKVDPSDTTKACPFCGLVEEHPERVAQINLTCPGCGEVYDQDWAGAINILRFGLAEIRDRSKNEGESK